MKGNNTTLIVKLPFKKEKNTNLKLPITDLRLNKDWVEVEEAKLRQTFQFHFTRIVKMKTTLFNFLKSSKVALNNEDILDMRVNEIRRKLPFQKKIRPIFCRS
jgi:hypothetical protein